MRLSAYTLVLAAAAVSSSESKAVRELAEEDSIRITLTATNQDLVSRMKTFLDTMTGTNDELVSQRNALNTVVKGLEEARKAAEENREENRKTAAVPIRTFAGKKYAYVGTIKKTWSEAEDWCKEKLGWDWGLLSIHSFEENKFVHEFERSQARGWVVNYPWIGLRKSGGNWTWSDGSTLDYTNWYSTTYREDEPDGDGDCVCIDNSLPPLNGQPQYALWFDVDCSEKLTFFCKEQ